jgi:hypothetical protein
MTDHSKATPRPWTSGKLGNDYDQHAIYQDDPRSGDTIAHVFGGDNAAMIVEAVNSHDRLVEENKRLREALEEIIKDMNVAMWQCCTSVPINQ